METFIARMIMEEADKTTDLGTEKYKKYFVNTRLYLKWKPEVDSILNNNGYGNVIPAE